MGPNPDNEVVANEDEPDRSREDNEEHKSLKKEQKEVDNLIKAT